VRRKLSQPRLHHGKKKEGEERPTSFQKREENIYILRKGAFNRFNHKEKRKLEILVIIPLGIWTMHLAKKKRGGKRTINGRACQRADTMLWDPPQVYFYWGNVINGCKGKKRRKR